MLTRLRLDEPYKSGVAERCPSIYPPQKITISENNTEQNTLVLGTPSAYLTSSYILDLD